MNLIDLAGWLGTALIVGAYMANINGRLPASSLAYQLCNLAGPLLIAAPMWAAGVWPGVVLQAVWALVAAVALARMARRLRRSEA